MTAPSLRRSLLALALIGGLVAVWRYRSRPLPLAAESNPPAPIADSTAVVLPANATKKIDSGPGNVVQFEWNSLHPDDYPRYIASLRAIECPEATIRDILIAAIERQFAPQEAPFKTPVPATAEPEDEPAAKLRRKAEYERRRALRTIELDKAALLKSLLGIDLALEPLPGWHSRNYARHAAAINAVPPEKREAVRRIQEAYWERADTLSDELVAKYQGKRTGEFMERYRANNTQRVAELAQVLTSEEVELFELRASRVAERLGKELVDFQPNEAEFRTIYQLRREIEEPYGGAVRAESVAGYQRDPAVEEKYREKLIAALGESRVTELDRVQNPIYQKVAQLQGRFGLGSEAINDAFQLIQESALPNNEGKAPPLDAAQLETRLRELLGDRAWTVLSASGINPPPTTKARIRTGLLVPPGP